MALGTGHRRRIRYAPPVRYMEIAVDVDAGLGDHLCGELSAAGVAVELRDATTLLKPPAGRALLVAWAEPARADETRALIEEVLASEGVASEVRLAEHDEDEWRDVWKQFFKPRDVGVFAIVPSWHRDHVPRAGQTVIEIDPGRAFGTGGHASTRLVLEALGRLPPPARVLDVGCGSGILGIACALRRPDCTVLALDIDPEAVATTRENAAINHVGDRVEAATTPLRDLTGAFDLVLANIQADVLVQLAGELSRQALGHLILSGLLDEQAASVSDAFAALDVLRPVERLSDEGWSAVVLERVR